MIHKLEDKTGPYGDYDTVPSLNSRSKPSRISEERPYYDPYPAVKVIIVGAGIAGIVASTLLPAKVPNLSYVLFDRNESVGGTWAQNRYPGVRCDVPSHAYQLTFAPNTNWSEYYAPGEEIRRYYETVADEYGVRPHLRLRHEVLRALWRDDLSHWEVEVQNLETNEVYMETAQFFISAQGRLNVPKLPTIPGLYSDFQGHVCHPAMWDESLDLSGKDIAIIGNGASGEQLLVNVLTKVRHIDHYVRSKQWILPTFADGLIEATQDLPGGYIFSDEEKMVFAAEPSAYLNFRKDLEKRLHGGLNGSIIGTVENEKIKQRCIKAMTERLQGDKEWLERLLPDYAPGCKRTTPAPGYLESLRHPKVTYVDNPITRATRTGLVDAEGIERKVDVIVTATGFENGFYPLFPIIGKNGIDLSKRWAPNGPTGYPETYFGIMAPDMPNYFGVLQAQAYGLGGTVPLHCETSVTFIAKAIRKIQSQGYTSLCPSMEATADFNLYVDRFFEDKVVGDSCNSWLKSGKGKTRTLFGWPGTGHHRMSICRDPRWEDFIFQKSVSSQNRFEYFGNGETEREQFKDDPALTAYLHEAGKIDLALLHENWNE